MNSSGQDSAENLNALTENNPTNKKQSPPKKQKLLQDPIKKIMKTNNRSFKF